MAQVKLPENVKIILEELHNKGHEACVVGGCVRDMILNQVPYDWDITTSAEPLEVKELFSKTVDTGLQHGTVTVLINGEGYEVTTYRIDGTYDDHRRPDFVDFTKSLEEDLKRRDFTINAMAYNEEDGFVDLYGGMKDLEAGIIRCVGIASERFFEDALRMLRAIRFSARFGFVIEDKTKEAIIEHSHLITKVSAERIHVELTKTLCSDNPTYIRKLVEFGLIKYILPEFLPNIGLVQNHPYHVYTVDEHIYKTLRNIESDEALRWAMYLHDIGKGYTKTTDDMGIDHFCGHAKVSVEKARDILNRLKFDNKTKDKIIKLIKYHDYRFEDSEKSVRKAMAKMGSDIFEAYIAVQVADIKGQTPSKLKERLSDLLSKKEKYDKIVSMKQCITIKELDINGSDLMALGVKPGQRVGRVLKELLEMVIEEPVLNKKEVLVVRVLEIIGEG